MGRGEYRTRGHRRQLRIYHNSYYLSMGQRKLLYQRELPAMFESAYINDSPQRAPNMTGKWRVL